MKIKIYKEKTEEKTLYDWFAEIFKLKPEIEEELEKNSAVMFDFDIIFPIFESEGFTPQNIYTGIIREQLAQWNIFEPVPKEEIKTIYFKLSKYVHGLAPDARDALVRALQGLPFPELKVIPEVLNTYAETLHKIVDISLVTTLNVLLKEESFYKEGEIKEALMKRLPDIEKLGLDFTTNKIKNLIEKQN